MGKTERNLNIDLVKILAVVSVIGIHFMAKAGFYEHAYDSPVIFLAVAVYSVLVSCVPLFLMTSGFLMRAKRYSKKYFLNLAKIIGIYVGAAIIYNLAEARTFDFHLLAKIIKNIFIFSHYSWYVNMYIGLYLIAPLLNAGFSALESKRQKVVLVAILSLLTVLPSTLNFVGRARGIDFLTIFGPNYWSSLWPICYYLIGSLLAEIGISPSQNRRKIALISPLLAIPGAVILYYLIQPSRTAFPPWQILPVFVVAVAIFWAAINLNFNVKSQSIRELIVFISNNTLSIYLLSVIGDTYVYPIILANQPSFSDLFWCSPLVIVGLFLLSLMITVFYKTFLATLAKAYVAFKKRPS